MRDPLKNIVAEIQKQERKLSANATSFIDEAFKMTVYLQELLCTLQEKVAKEGFSTKDEEIHFFKQVKPNILGKLIYYNKVYRIETACPVDNGNLNQNYYALQLRGLTQEYKEHVCSSAFYRYYRSGRTDRDENYFMRGNITIVYITYKATSRFDP